MKMSLKIVPVKRRNYSGQSTQSFHSIIVFGSWLGILCFDNQELSAIDRTHTRMLFNRPFLNFVKPLMYKHGWKKSVTLCLSVSIAEGVRDVTFRYNDEYTMAASQLYESRKKYFDEQWLREFLKKRIVFFW